MEIFLIVISMQKKEHGIFIIDTLGERKLRQIGLIPQIFKTKLLSQFSKTGMTNFSKEGFS